VNKHFSIGSSVGVFRSGFEGNSSGKELLVNKSVVRVVSVVEVSEVSDNFDFVSVESNGGVGWRGSIVPVEFHISGSGFLLSEGNRRLTLSVFAASIPVFLEVPGPVVFNEIRFRGEKRVFVEDVLSGKSSQDEFGSETLDLVEFFSAN